MGFRRGGSDEEGYFSPDLVTPDVMTFDPKYVYVTAEKAGNIVVISKTERSAWRMMECSGKLSHPRG